MFLAGKCIKIMFFLFFIKIFLTSIHSNDPKIFFLKIKFLKNNVSTEFPNTYWSACQNSPINLTEKTEGEEADPKQRADFDSYSHRHQGPEG